jgi:MFS family permease
LKISAEQLGWLLSAFFWTYASCQIVAGWLVDRLDVKYVFAVGFAVWSAATAVTGLVHGLVALFTIRILLGIGESVAYPAYSKIVPRLYPEEGRGFANGMISTGLALGPGLGLLFGGVLMARFCCGLGRGCDGCLRHPSDRRRASNRGRGGGNWYGVGSCGRCRYAYSAGTTRCISRSPGCRITW